MEPAQTPNEPLPVASSSPAVVAPPSASPDKKISTVMIVVILVIVIAIGATLGFMFMLPKPSSTNTTTPTNYPSISVTPTTVYQNPFAVTPTASAAANPFDEQPVNPFDNL